MIYKIKQIIYDYKFKLHAAARDGHVDAVKKYLASGWDVNRKSTLWERTPLHCATKFEIAKLLLDNNADINAQDEEGETRLDYLCRMLSYSDYEKEEVELLVARGANVNTTSMGKTPLDFAIRNNKTEIADILRKHGAKKMSDIYPNPIKNLSIKELYSRKGRVSQDGNGFYDY